MKGDKHTSYIHSTDQIKETAVLLFVFCKITGVQRSQGCRDSFWFYKWCMSVDRFSRVGGGEKVSLRVSVLYYPINVVISTLGHALHPGGLNKDSLNAWTPFGVILFKEPCCSVSSFSSKITIKWWTTITARNLVLLSYHTEVQLGFIQNIMILQNSLNMKREEHMITLKFIVVLAAWRWWGMAVKH